MSSSTDHTSAKPYIVGFILSIVLTIIPLELVLNHMMSFRALIVTIIAIAVIQFLVQLFFFMHIRESEKPAYNVWALVLGIFIVITIVGASSWIMTFNSQVQ